MLNEKNKTNSMKSWQIIENHKSIYIYIYITYSIMEALFMSEFVLLHVFYINPHHDFTLMHII